MFLLLFNEKKCRSCLHILQSADKRDLGKCTNEAIMALVHLRNLDMQLISEFHIHDKFGIYPPLKTPHTKNTTKNKKLLQVQQTLILCTKSATVIMDRREYIFLSPQQRACFVLVWITKHAAKERTLFQYYPNSFAGRMLSRRRGIVSDFGWFEL